MKSFSKVDLDEALASVSPRVKVAFEMSHEMLRNAGIPHIIIGGLAVNAHGYHYSTQDVDYLVHDEDAFTGSFVIVHKAGVPHKIGDVDVDYVLDSASDHPAEIKSAMRDCIEAARQLPEKVAVIPDWLLVWMKLSVNRAKDRAAVVELIHHGLDVSHVRKMLLDVSATDVLEVFSRCVDDAASEERG